MNKQIKWVIDIIPPKKCSEVILFDYADNQQRD